MIRLYFDEDSLGRALLQALRQQGVDLTTTQEQGMRRAADAAQLDFASSLGRVLVTANTGHFVRLHGEYLSSGRHHAGIIVIQQQRWGIGEQLQRLLNLMHTKTEAEMADWLEFLSRWG